MNENENIMINEENIEVTPENTEITTAVDAETGEEVYVTGLTTGEKVVGVAGAGLAIYGAVDLSIKGFRLIKNKVAPKVKAGFKKIFGKKEPVVETTAEIVETTEE